MVLVGTVGSVVDILDVLEVVPYIAYGDEAGTLNFQGRVQEDKASHPLATTTGNLTALLYLDKLTPKSSC